MEHKYKQKTIQKPNKKFVMVVMMFVERAYDSISMLCKELVGDCSAVCAPTE